MTESQLFKGNPLLKLAMPMMLGIAVAWHSEMAMSQVLSLSALSVFVLLFGLLRFTPKWLFGVGVVGFMFSAGAFVESRQREAMQPQWAGESRYYEAQLLEVPDHRGTVTKVLAGVTAVDSALPKNARRQGEAYLYLQRSVDADELEAGDVLRFKAEMRVPENAGNPAEFDSREYHYIKGVTGSAFLWDGSWNRLRKGEKNLSMQALQLRERVVDKYASIGFGGESLALLSALTVGEKRDFPRELKESYSVAGASHVLALSGLHLGIFYLLLSTLLPLRGRNRLLVVLRECVIVAALWGFAYIAGLSPSVARSAILFTLMSFGRCMHQESSGISSLAFAAIMMLLFSPHALFDISFQLSFAAVFAILLLAPPLQQLLKVDEHGTLYGYLANLLILSLAAQVGTLPFVWYHFGVLPLYSLLTNIFVVPLAFVVIALALAMLAASFFHPLQQLIADVLAFVVETMNGGIAFVASLPGASFALPPIGLGGAACVTILLVLMAYALFSRRWWLVALVAGGSAVLCAVNSVQDEEALPGGVIVYNNNRNPLLHIVGDGGENWLLSTVPQLDAEYEYVSSPYIKREGLDEPEWVSGAFFCDLFEHDEGLLLYGGLKIRMVSDGLWRENLYTAPTDVVILCRGFLGSIKELYEVYSPGCLLLDASLYKHSRERILRECAQLGVEAVDISRSGAILIVPQGDSFEIMPLRGK